MSVIRKFLKSVGERLIKSPLSMELFLFRNCFTGGGFNIARSWARVFFYVIMNLKSNLFYKNLPVVLNGVFVVLVL